MTTDELRAMAKTEISTIVRRFQTLLKFRIWSPSQVDHYIYLN